MKLVVDPIRCDGRGLCAELLPWLVALDDWGFPMIRDSEIDEPTLAEAAEAIRVCPRLALRLVARRE